MSHAGWEVRRRTARSDPQAAWLAPRLLIQLSTQAPHHTEGKSGARRAMKSFGSGTKRTHEGGSGQGAYCARTARRRRSVRRAVRVAQAPSVFLVSSYDGRHGRSGRSGAGSIPSAFPKNIDLPRRVGPGQVVRFDMNSSPWAGAGLASVGAIPINEYPDSTYATLTAALARYTGASADGITVGAGADELLDLVAKAFIGPGDPVLVTEPSYAMHRVLSEQVGGDVHRVEAQNWLLDRNTYLRWAARSRVTWICNPNNPTGE